MVSGKLVPGNMVPENSEPKNRGVSVEHRGVCVCGMFGCDPQCDPQCDVKPKTRQQIFVDSFSVLQFGTYVGS